MATKEKEKEQKNDETSNQLMQIQTEEGKIVSVEEIFKQIENAEVGMEIGADYFKIEPGEQKRVLFVEMTEMNGIGEKNGQMIPAVRLMAGDGRFKINADKVLVSTCRALSEKGRKNVPIQITCKGMLKGPKGSYRDLVVNELLM